MIKIEMATIVPCEWIYDDDLGAWVTSCDKLFVLNDGTPAENNMQFCCYCGKSLAQIELKDEEGR